MGSEAEVIAASGPGPVTVGQLVEDLTALGIGPGDVVMAHSSLSALGWVVGGSQGVIQALIAAVGDNGTPVMPTHTGQLTDPARCAGAVTEDAASAGRQFFDRKIAEGKIRNEAMRCLGSDRLSRRAPQHDR